MQRECYVRVLSINRPCKINLNREIRPIIVNSFQVSFTIWLKSSLVFRVANDTESLQAIYNCLKYV